MLKIRVEEPSQSKAHTLMSAVDALAWKYCKPNQDQVPDGLIDVSSQLVGIPRSATQVERDQQGTVWKTSQHWWVERAAYCVALERDSVRATLYMDHTDQEIQASLAYAIRDIITLLLPHTGWIPLHAACVVPAGAPDEGVLLVGASGAGKSTLTLGMLMQGARCVSDDLLLIAQEQARKSKNTRSGGVAVYSMMRDMRVCNDAWERLGLCKDHAGSSGVFAIHAAVEKHTLTAAAMSKRSSTAELRTASSSPTRILLPTITSHPRSRLVPVSRAEALPDLLSQMVPATMLPADVQHDQLERTAALLRQCTAYRLHAGRDLYHNPGHLAALLQTTTAFA